MTAIRTFFQFSVESRAQILHIFLHILFFHDLRHCRPMPLFFSGDLADVFSGDELLFDALPLWKWN